MVTKKLRSEPVGVGGCGAQEQLLAGCGVMDKKMEIVLLKHEKMENFTPKMAPKVAQTGSEATGLEHPHSPRSTPSTRGAGALPKDCWIH